MAEAAHIAEDDAEALRVRRAELHDFMREVAAAALMLPQPETHLEAERSVRAITMADRMAQILRDAGLDKAEEAGEDKQDTPPPPKQARDPIRTALRSLADRIMTAAKTLPMPDSALGVWRALRYARACERMLVQLYAAPKPKPKPKPEPKPALPAVKRSPEEIRAYYKQIEKELWEKFSPSPEARALREARQRAAKAAFDAEIAAEMAELTAPKPGTNVDSKAENTKTSTDDSLNPRPDISEGQNANPSGQIPAPP